MKHLYLVLAMRATIVYFEMHVLTHWELKHLPIILITGNECGLTDESMYPEQKSHEYKEMQTI
jgi:hypothetical protein